MKLESRGVRCLECAGLDLTTYPEQARCGFGWCSSADLPHFVAVSNARNCYDFAPAPAGSADKRAALVDAKEVLFWRKK